MPLPHIKKLCSAKSKRTGQPCRNPAAYGCRTCKTHGARRIRYGTESPNYRHGKYSEAVIEKYRVDMARLHELEQIGFASGLLRGEKTRGRKLQLIND